VLLQKLPADPFVATAKVMFMPQFEGEETGLVMLGQSYAYIGLRKTTNGLEVRQVERRGADNGGDQTESKPARVACNTLYLRASVQPGAVVTFSYSEDGTTFHELGTPFQAVAGRWFGAKIGLFAVGSLTRELGYADYDSFRITQ
jgi:beta-xylosidase